VIEELIVMLGAMIIVVVIINYEIWKVRKDLEDEIWDIWRYLDEISRRRKRKNK